MNLSSKLSTDVIFGFLVQFAIRLRGLVFIPIITMSLGVGAFGAYSQIVGLASLCGMVFSLGLYDALVRFGKERGTNVADVYYSHLAITIVLSSVATVVVFRNAGLLSALTLNSASYTPAFEIGSVLILTRTVFRIQWNYFRIGSNIKLFSFLQGLRAYGLVGGVTLAVYYYGGGVSEIILSMVVVESALVLSMQSYISWNLGVEIPRFANIGSHLRYALPIVGSNFGENSLGRADRVLLGFFIGSEAVGLYSIAYQIASVISIYLTPIRQTFFPKFSELIEDDNFEQCTEYLREVVRYFLLVSIPSVAGIYLVGPEVIRVLIGTDNPAPSGILLSLIAAGFLFHGLDQIYAVMLRANKQTADLSVILGVAAIANVAFNVAFIPLFGVEGAAISTVLSYAISFVLVYYDVGKLVPLDFCVLTVARGVLCSGIMVVISEIVYPSTIAVVIPGCVAVYVLSLLATREVSREEIRSIY